MGSRPPDSRPVPRWLARLSEDRWARFAVVLVSVLVLPSLFADWLPLIDPHRTALDRRLLEPFSAGHWLGTDQLGRDLLSRLLYGTRLSLLVAGFGVGVAAVVGSVVGLLGAYYGRWLDGLLMRGIDVLMAFPYLLLALAIVSVLGPGLANAALAIAVVNVPFFARTLRGQALAVQRAAFVDAARLGGLGDARILFGEVLPNVLPVLLVATSTSLGWMILETAGLSFLGLGAQPPTADLGGMLGQARHLLATHPHVCLLPGAVIFALVIGLNVLGDALRDALEPRSEALPSPAERLDETSSSEPSVTDQQLDADGPDALLHVDGLSVRFGARTAVEEVSFTLRRGERVALVGESGSGKSVTALALLDLVPGAQLSARALEFDGRPLLGSTDWHSLRGRQIAWIPQDPMTSLHPMFSIGRQLTESLRLQRGESGETALETARSLLAQVGIADPRNVLHAFPHQLSGGMRQRVVIAMALCGQPELLIADEPTTALDVTTQAQVLERLRSLCDAHNTALLFISHDLAVTGQLCSRVLVLRRGRLIEQASTRALLKNPRQSYTRRLLAAVPELGRPEKLLRTARRKDSPGASPSTERNPT